MTTRLLADFNGLFEDLLCLSHSDEAENDRGESCVLSEGLDVLAFESDGDEFLVARGKVERSPDSLKCLGSRWCLRIDDNGVRHVTTLNDV
jgi:hypothetical protein